MTHLDKTGFKRLWNHVVSADDTVLTSANEYTDEKTANLSSNTYVNEQIDTHNVSTDAHADIREIVGTLTTKLNEFLDVDDIETNQLSEILTLINDNKNLLETLSENKLDKSNIVDNLITSNTSKVLSANQGVVIKSLIDTLANTLQEQLDNKSNSDHTHNDMYYTEIEMDTKISKIDSSVEDITTSIANIIDGTTMVGNSINATISENANNALVSEKSIKDNSGNVITDTYETKYDANSKLNESKLYADGIKNDLLNGAGEAYDTLKELGELIDTNTDAIDALEIVATGKADKIHIHTISDVTDLQNTLDSKVNISRTINEYPLTDNIVLTPLDIGADPSGSAETALLTAKEYTDDEIIENTQAMTNEQIDAICGELSGDGSVVPIILTQRQITVPYASEVIVNANTMTTIGVLTESCTIALSAGINGFDNEWSFIITQGDTAYDVVLPEIQWGLGIAPTFSVNTSTLCRLYYIGSFLCGEWMTV